MNTNSPGVIGERVARIRAWMIENDAVAVIIPSTDPHQSEYPAERDRVRAWVSGFHGSAGTVIITEIDAGLWTDSRYFLEAETVLQGTEFVLHRLHTGDTLDYPEWLASRFSRDCRVAVDFRTVTVSMVRRLESVGIATLIDLGDAIETIWTDRPPRPSEPLTVLPLEVTGEDAKSKLERVRSEMKRFGAESHIVATLDDIAWILNIRGSDVAYNPVFLSYLVITDDEVRLYTDGNRVDDTTKGYLQEIGVSVFEYDRFRNDTIAPSGSASKGLRGPVLIDPERTSYAIVRRCEGVNIIEKPQPSTGMKARKNGTELANLRDTMRHDGAALVRFLRRLDRSIRDGDRVTELSAAQMLREERRKIPGYVSDSFTYISGFNGNGAIVHYSADETRDATITPPGIYLIDSGGQFRTGTTDITRTVAIGEPPPGAVTDYTLVLKGHIALARLVFPENTSGRDIDAIARVPLWSHLMNYGHGTGHGVGYALNVHEGPQRIAPGAPPWPLEDGMVVSDEPGVYRTGQWGIRIENLLAVRRRGASELGRFLEFETLTLCPLDLRMIDTALLTDDERRWIDEYHRWVRDELTPLLDDADMEWLGHATAALGDQMEKRTDSPGDPGHATARLPR
ncbi:MAG: aminopeptidase P family protein [Alkalispirochaeta sp.]